MHLLQVFSDFCFGKWCFSSETNMKPSWLKLKTSVFQSNDIFFLFVSCFKRKSSWYSNMTNSSVIVSCEVIYSQPNYHEFFYLLVSFAQILVSVFVCVCACFIQIWAELCIYIAMTSDMTLKNEVVFFWLKCKLLYNEKSDKQRPRRVLTQSPRC